MAHEDLDPRAARLAQNEARFRDINERLERDLRAIADGARDDERFPFVCECARNACSETIPLTFGEYEAVRQDPMTFAVAPGHAIEDVEDVVDRADGHWVLRKHEPARGIAERTDPRGV